MKATLSVLAHICALMFVGLLALLYIPGALAYAIAEPLYRRARAATPTPASRRD